MPLLISLSPTVDDDLSALWSPGSFTFAAPISRSSLAREQPLLYQFLLNKWYFDEIYDFLFVRPAMWLGRLFWKGGDGWYHRRLRA